MAFARGPKTVTDGLVLYLDAFNHKSYPGSGSTEWNNLTKGSNAIINYPEYYSTDFGGSFNLEGGTLLNISPPNLTNWTVAAWMKYTYDKYKTNILTIPTSTGNISGRILWHSDRFQGFSSISHDTTGNIYIGTFGNTEWDDVKQIFGFKIDASGSAVTEFNQGYTPGSAINQHQTYIGNDGYLYTSGTNLDFFAKRNKETGEKLSSVSAGAATINSYFVVDEDNRKVYHTGGYTTAFGLPRKYLCKFDLDTFEVDEIFDTSNGLNAQPGANQIFLTSDKYLYAFGSSISSYKGTSINHIVKLDQSGSLDPNFNPGVGFDNSSTIFCKIDSQDRLVCLGRYFDSYSGSYSPHIVRINTDGTKDDTFNVGTGLNLVGYPGGITIQNDDKVIVTGYFSNYSGSAVSGIVRINTDGTKDDTFNVGTGFGSTDGRAITPHALPNGEILLISGEVRNTPFTWNGTTFKNIIQLDSSGSYIDTFNTGSGFTDSTRRAFLQISVKNLSGTLGTIYDYGAWPTVGGRDADVFWKNTLEGWNYVVFTKDENNILRQYNNGELVDSQTIVTSSFQNLDLEVDQLLSSNSTKVPLVQIYNRPLTPDEVLQNYNSIKVRYST